MWVLVLPREEAQSQLSVLCRHHHVHLAKASVLLCLLPSAANEAFAVASISTLLSCFKGGDREQSPCPHAKQGRGKSRTRKPMLLLVLASRRVRLGCAVQPWLVFCRCQIILGWESQVFSGCSPSQLASDSQLELATEREFVSWRLV